MPRSIAVHGVIAIGLTMAHAASPAAEPSASTTTTEHADAHRSAGAADRSTGNASFYAHRFTGRKTASGDRYDPAALTAAHRTLPMGTKLKVVNPTNDRSVVVTVNDRGPRHGNRMLDVSSAAAEKLGMRKSGVTKVHTEVVDRVAGQPDETTGDSPGAGR